MSVGHSVDYRISQGIMRSQNSSCNLQVIPSKFI